MNQKNLEFLRNQIKYTGFGETLEGALKEKLEKGDLEFKIKHEVTFGSDSLSVNMNFKKSDQSDMYFFNSYQVKLQKEETKDALEQTFYINKDSNITIKEAYNLLEGRAVNKDFKTKEGETYNAWISLDFKIADSDNGNFKLNHYHQNYGYDLEAVLSKYPIKELETPDYKENLLASLKKGNVQSATFKIDGADKKQFIEANPQFKTIKIYDSAMQRINNRQSKEQKQTDTEGKSVVKDNKKDQNENTETPETSERKTQKKKSKTNLI